MVSCDEATKVMRAGAHLVNDLRVPAIVGPNTSQDTIDLSNNLTIQAGTVLMTPTAVASSIPELMDNDFTWLMVPSDKQRGKLMIDQINQLERDLNMQGKSPVRLGIVYRNDALGLGTQRSLNDLILNGKPLNDPINAGSPTGNVTIDGYDFSAPNQDTLVNRYVTFAPDIIVLAGTAEAITAVMNPLEARWPDGGAARPSYVLIDSAKVPELLTAAANANLRARVRGTGITPGAASDPVKTSFELDYRARYGATPTASGVGPSYDAAYAIAYALSATKDLPVIGLNIAKGLRKLAGGPTIVNVGSSSVLTAFTHLGAGENITGIGTFVPLEWDDRGAVVGGTLEVWCIGAPAGSAAFQSSGYFYDIKSDMYSGAYTPCTP
jgi:branched-chain amino acid transport system substrate-binding protein